MKKIVVGLCVVLAAGMIAACGQQTASTASGTGKAESTKEESKKKEETKQESKTETSSGSSVQEAESIMQIPNPWVDCYALEEAAEIAGFAFEAPDFMAGYQQIRIRAMEDTMIEVVYADAEELIENESADDLDCLTARKAHDTGEDISGDYNTYSVNEDVQMEGVTVSLRGEKDDDGDENDYHVALWNKDGFSFCIVSEHDLDLEEIKVMVGLLG